MWLSRHLARVDVSCSWVTLFAPILPSWLTLSTIVQTRGASSQKTSLCVSNELPEVHVRVSCTRWWRPRSSILRAELQAWQEWSSFSQRHLHGTQSCWFHSHCNQSWMCAMPVASWQRTYAWMFARLLVCSGRCPCLCLRCIIPQSTLPTVQVSCRIQAPRVEAVEAVLWPLVFCAAFRVTS